MALGQIQKTIRLDEYKRLRGIAGAIQAKDRLKDSEQFFADFHFLDPPPPPTVTISVAEWELLAGYEQRFLNSIGRGNA